MRTLPIALAIVVLSACGPDAHDECTVCGDNACVDIQSDNDNCGGCGVTCPGTMVCISGQCDVGEPCSDVGASEDCYTGWNGTEGVGVCHGGTRTCDANGYWSGCHGEVAPTFDMCGSGADEDCDGATDEETDNDGDGFTNCTGDCCDSSAEGCTVPGAVNPGAFDAPGNHLDDDCDGTFDNSQALCDSGLASSSADAMDYARAMDICQQATPGRWGVVSARFVKADGTGAPLPVQRAIRPDFGQTQVQLGDQLVVLSTANAATPTQQNPPFSTFQSTDHLAESGYPADWMALINNTLPNAPGCPPPLDGGAYDPIMLELKIRVPTNAQSFSMKTNFMSAEFPEWVCTEYNDFFVVLLKSMYAGDPPNPADMNLAFYQDGDMQRYPVGVNLASANSGLFTQCVNGEYGCLGDTGGDINTCSGTNELVGTGMDTADNGCGGGDQIGGGTGWLSTSGNVKPGEEITLRIGLWDTSDGAYDSVAIIDAFQWSIDPSDPGTIIVE